MGLHFIKLKSQLKPKGHSQSGDETMMRTLFQIQFLEKKQSP